jgi:mono/diheme cytochrome c family protein
VAHQTGRRATLLLAIGVVAVGLVACGQASESDIFEAVGITPTATQSAEEIAAMTATVSAQQTASAGTPAVDVAALGDVTQGKNTFNTYCAQCHTPGGGGVGPDLLAAGGPGALLDIESFTAFLRAGEDHPPGPYQSFDISDRQVGNIAAYIVAESQS